MTVCLHLITHEERQDCGRYIIVLEVCNECGKQVYRWVEDKDTRQEDQGDE